MSKSTAATVTAGERHANNVPATGKHTPGPWQVFAGTIIQDASGRFLTVTPESHQLVADEQGSDERDKAFWETRANARLMAAAPELLNALYQLHAWCTIEGHDNSVVREARAIIAKAEGRAE